MNRILITGATGFVGTAVCRRIIQTGWKVRSAVRSLPDHVRLVAGTEVFPVGSIGPDTEWAKALAEVDVVIHLAARTHVTREVHADPLKTYRLTNVEGTTRLARAAASAGVKRFIFLSSVKALGEGRVAPYTERDAAAPEDPYGISKWETEQALHRISRETGIELVILRPPLIYGPGVKANFLQLMGIVWRGIPLPFANVDNRRSFLYVENLVDLIGQCCYRPEAAGKTYLVSDGDDVSTPELITRIADCFCRPARLFPFPDGILRLAGRLSGRSASIERLLGSLIVDSSFVRRDLAWQVPYTLEQGLQDTVRWYISRRT